MERHYPYLIIGGGMTADAAARGIRQVDSEGKIGLISSETDPPYNRPPLSKGLWKSVRPTPLSRIWRNTASLGVDLHLGRSATALEPAAQRVTDDQGDTYTYEKLLLATGGTPIRPWPEHERVIYYRTLADYRRLRTLTETGQRFVVIGGGFIGSEMAAVLTGLGKEVVMIFPERGIGARVLPEAISLHLNQLFRNRGVRVLDGHLVADLQPASTGVTIRTNLGETLQADAVVAGLGIRPNTWLAEAAGIETGNGIRVDSAMRSSHLDIFAAGDVACFPSPTHGKQIRVEHEENANLTGMLAGMGMAGQPGSYEALPSVYSTIFDINYDAVGSLDPLLEIAYEWQEPFQKGVIYYLASGTVQGVLLWNVGRGLDTARQLIGQPYTPGSIFIS